jgi:type III secretion protein J
MKTGCRTRGVLLVMLFAVAGCKQQLYTSLSERDANEMIAVLAAKNLQAEKVTNDKGDFRIELKQSDFSAAVEALRDNGLPRAKFSTIGEVFKKEGLVTTANSERLRFMFAMSEELSKTISLIDGVVEARVHPVLPGGDPLTDKLTPASASVFIKHTPDANLTMLAPAIKDMVSASIEGLSYDKVALTFVPAIKMAAAVPAAQQVFGASQMQNQTPTLFGFPALGLGLASAFLILGIGLFALRRREPADIEQGQRARKQTRTVQPTMWLAERLSTEIRKALGKIRREKLGTRRGFSAAQPTPKPDQTAVHQPDVAVPASPNAGNAGIASK